MDGRELQRMLRHAWQLGYEGIVSKRLGSRYVSCRSCDWLKFKNSNAPAVKRDAKGRMGHSIDSRSCDDSRDGAFGFF
jgi:ATP-dependent DNA ligase